MTGANFSIVHGMDLVLCPGNSFAKSAVVKKRPQGDGLSVVTDNDETGFRVVEYGKSRKIVLPAPWKREIREIGSRELRRRGIGQHSIERALHEHVRVNTYRKIVAAIEESKKV